MPRKLVFLARDGGLLERTGAERLDAIGLVPGVVPALLRLTGAGYEPVVIAAGAPDARAEEGAAGAVAAGPADGAATQIDAFLARVLASQGLPLAPFLRCPHDAGTGCDCRPPGLGLVRAYLGADVLDRAASAVVGDTEAYLELAANMGLAGFRLGPGDGSDAGPATHPAAASWGEVAHALLDRPRTARVRRKTRETDIEIQVDLDREADPRAATGIGFFDHMLEQLGKHGGFALEVTCHGDLEIDEHHTVEDVALALGQALKQALGDKRGIGRYGFLLPMDEADAEIALDLGGRPYLVFEGRFARERVGELPTELVPHFFRSLAETLGAALHIRLRGENTHHMVEAAFKGVARTLRQAIARRGEALPTTKGLL